MGTAVSIRTLLPGDFYLLFPDLVTLGFVLANGEATARFDLNGDDACHILPIGHERCVERFKGSELSVQLGRNDAGGADALKTGSLVVARTRRRHFLALLLPDPQRFAYIDLEDWRLAAALPDASFEVHNNWKFLRGWDGMLVHEFH